MKEMRILGIDPGIHSCGLCVINGEGKILHHNKVDVSKMDLPEGLYKMHTAFVDTLKNRHCGILAIEWPMFASFQSKSLGVLMMVLSQGMTAGYEMDCDVQTYKCSEWRKIIGLKKKEGSKDWKVPAVEYCEFWTGKKLKHDEAEAYCIAKACLKEYQEAINVDERQEATR